MGGPKSRDIDADNAGMQLTPDSNHDALLKPHLIGASGKAFGPVSPMQMMTPTEVSRAIAEAHRMYHRMLAGWAQDVLLLRGTHGGGLRWRSSTDDEGHALAA